MNKVENGGLLHSHQQVEYGFFQSFITSKSFIWYLKCIYVESFLSLLLVNQEIMKWLCRSNSITFSFFFCIYQIRALQMEVRPPHILCMVMAVMFAFLSLVQHLLVHKPTSKEPKGFLIKGDCSKNNVRFWQATFVFTFLSFFLVFRNY